MVFLLFRNFFRKFAVPGPLLFWSLAGVPRFRSLYFQSSFPFLPASFPLVFLLFRNFFRKFAVPGPLLFWSLAGVPRFRSLYFQSSFPFLPASFPFLFPGSVPCIFSHLSRFCPLVFPFSRAVSAVFPSNFSLFSVLFPLFPPGTFPFFSWCFSFFSDFLR